MYRVTIRNKEDSFEKVILNYESRTDAFLMIENVFAGDMDNIYECKIEIIDEENSNDVD